MALSGWLSNCELTINSSVVPSDATDLPVLLIYDNFPSEIVATSGGCQDDGSDIRFATDATGDTEIPREIVNIDKTSNILTVYVKVPSISSSTDTIIYCFWNNASADEPGDGAASNKLSVWDDFYGVFHYQDVTDDWKGIADSSGKWSNQTAIGTVSTGDGHASGTKALNLDTSFGVSLHEVMTFNDSATNDLMFWCNFNGTASTGNIATGFNGIPLGWISSGQFGAGWGNFSTTTNAVSLTGWHHVWVRNVAGVASSYVDGVDATLVSTTTQSEQFTTWGLGTSVAPTWDCSEMRMTRDVNTSVANVETMVANESDPASFITPGTAQVSASGYTLGFTGLEVDTEIRIYAVSDGSELAGVENSTTTFEWSYEYTGDFDVNVYIHNVDYDYIAFRDLTVSNADTSIPIQQQFDRYKI